MLKHTDKLRTNVFKPLKESLEFRFYFETDCRIERREVRSGLQIRETLSPSRKLIYERRSTHSVFTDHCGQHDFNY